MKITVNDLHFTYPGNVNALKGINVTIQSGEKVAIVGQNGAGKTTLVRHFNGLLKPTSGIVTVGDWDTKYHSIAQLASRVGYVFQNPDDQLFSRTVQAEIMFGPKNLGYPPEVIKRLVQKAILLTELTGQEHTNPYDLSSSWRKMVAMASIIAMDTPVLILDEPTTGQDAVNIARIAQMVQTLHQNGKTVITITHDIDFCAENFDRIIALSQGQVLLDGPTGEVIAQDELLATTYVDPPQLTRLGKRLGLPVTIRNQAEFLNAYRKLREQVEN